MAQVTVYSDWFGTQVFKDDGALEPKTAQEEAARKAIVYLGQYVGKGAEEDPLDRQPDVNE